MYADGRQCSGHIYRAKAYGPKRRNWFIDRHDVRKYRLWCSEKDDHAGWVSCRETKDRMEFYPDQLPAGLEEELWAGNLLEKW